MRRARLPCLLGVATSVASGTAASAAGGRRERRGDAGRKAADGGDASGGRRERGGDASRQPRTEARLGNAGRGTAD